MRVFPISNWTELDIWQYIARENLELPRFYYSHKREVVRRKGLLVPVTPLTPKLPNEVQRSIKMFVSVLWAILAVLVQWLAPHQHH